MSIKDLNKLKVTELKKKLKKLGVKGYSKLKKSDLIKKLNSVMKKNDKINLDNKDIVKGAEHKYNDSKQKKKIIQEKIKIPKTAQYETDKLILLVKDPEWLFAYWDISSKTKFDILKKYNKSDWKSLKKIIRLYIINDNNIQEFQDITVNEFANNWYLKIPSVNKEFFIELGISPDNESFYKILTSNKIVTPNDKVSDITDEEWITSDEEYQKIIEASGGIIGNVGSSGILNSQEDIQKFDIEQFMSSFDNATSSYINKD